jgi:hypothetical protein
MEDCFGKEEEGKRLAEGKTIGIGRRKEKLGGNRMDIISNDEVIDEGLALGLLMGTSMTLNKL